MGLDSSYTSTNGLGYHNFNNSVVSTTDILPSAFLNALITNTFNNQPVLHPINEIIIKFGNLRPNVYTSSSIQASFRIQVKPDNNNIINIDTASNISNIINMPPTTLEYLDVSLLDLNNNLIQLLANWSFTLAIKYLS